MCTQGDFAGRKNAMRCVREPFRYQKAGNVRLHACLPVLYWQQETQSGVVHRTNDERQGDARPAARRPVVQPERGNGERRASEVNGADPVQRDEPRCQRRYTQSETGLHRPMILLCRWSA